MIKLLTQTHPGSNNVSSRNQKQAQKARADAEKVYQKTRGVMLKFVEDWNREVGKQLLLFGNTRITSTLWNFTSRHEQTVRF